MSTEEQREDLILSFVVSTLDMEDEAIQKTWAPAIDAVLGALQHDEEVSSSAPLRASSVHKGPSIVVVTDKRVFVQPNPPFAGHELVFAVEEIEYVGQIKASPSRPERAEITIGRPQDTLTFHGTLDDLALLAGALDEAVDLS